MTTPYEEGRRFAYRASMAFARDGYEIIRSAGSKTKVDFVAFKEVPQAQTTWAGLPPKGELLFVQVKKSTSGTIPADERAELLRLANIARAVPIVVHKRIPRGFAFRRLTGPGPKDWQPWTPDEVAP
jgi:Holliday junction resolvase